MNNGKICISVCAETADELIEQIKRAEDLADIIEIRFDCLSSLHLEKFLLSFKNLKQKFLATYRPLEQGGKRYLELSERRKFFESVSNNSNINIKFFDIEPDLQKEFSRRRINPRIASYHNFDELNDDLEFVYNELSETSPEIIKIAAQTKDIAGTIQIWKLLEKAKSESKQIVPIAMGESGKWTRILGLAHGAFMTYAALGSGKETASGQVSAKDLIEVYRVRELDENTEVYGILGNNTSVSMSPYIHNAAFKFHKLNSVFVPLQTHDPDEFIKRMVKPETREIDLNFKGFSVTIPHKEAIIKHLDFIDEATKKIGAVNTVKIVDGKLYGYNTDANGFIEPLKNAYGDLKNSKVAILGAGGSARACIYALKSEGASVTVFARNLEKAKSLTEDFEVELKQLSTSNEQRTTFKEFDILVNTTPLGMKGKADGETPAFAGQLEDLKLVYDLIYIPFQTPLMKEADKANVPKIGGLAMLVGQAMEQQKIWTGLDAPMKEMSRAALEKLQA